MWAPAWKPKDADWPGAREAPVKTKVSPCWVPWAFHVPYSRRPEAEPLETLIDQVAAFVPVLVIFAMPT